MITSSDKKKHDSSTLLSQLQIFYLHTFVYLFLRKNNNIWLHFLSTYFFSVVYRRHNTVCNERRSTISCRWGQTLKILSAVYGRSQVWTCRPRNKKQTMCRINVLRQVQEMCQQKKSCRLYASNRVFNKPCSGTEKYLRIKYQCLKGM